MKTGALPFVAVAVVAIAHCSSSGANSGCPNANDIDVGGSCSVEGVTCPATDFCNTGAPSEAVCKQGTWGAPPGCIEGGAYSPCMQLGGTCKTSCAPGTHAVAAACSNFTDSCCVAGDADAGDAGDAGD